MTTFIRDFLLGYCTHVMLISFALYERTRGCNKDDHSFVIIWYIILFEKVKVHNFAFDHIIKKFYSDENFHHVCSHPTDRCHTVTPCLFLKRKSRTYVYHVSKKWYILGLAKQTQNTLSNKENTRETAQEPSDTTPHKLNLWGLVSSKKLKISRHIESCDTCMKYKILTKIKINYTIYL